jgi:hypothetical protein
MFPDPFGETKSLAPGEYETPFTRSSLLLYELSYCVVKSVVLPDV